MATLTEARQILAAALGAPAHVPEVIDPPTNVIEPGEPYLAHAKEFGWRDYIVHFDVYVLVGLDDNEDAVNALDGALLDAMEAIDSAGFSVDLVGKPGLHLTAEWVAYGVKLSVTGRIKRPDPAPEGTP